MKEKIVRLFVKTLDRAYFKKLLDCITNRISYVVIAGEQVGDAIKEGKLNGAIEKFKKPSFQKKEGEVHMVQNKNYPPKNKLYQPTYQHSPYSMSPFYPYSYLRHPYGPLHHESHTPFSINNVFFSNIPVNSLVNASSSSPQSQPNKPRRDRLTIELIPLSCSDLYDCLLKENLVGLEVLKPISNPSPKWYNANETCKYHMDAPGHSIERCISFKVCM